MPGFLGNLRAAQSFFFAKTDLRFFVYVDFFKFFCIRRFFRMRNYSSLFWMQNLKPNNLEIFVRPNSNCEIVNYPMIMQA